MTVVRQLQSSIGDTLSTTRHHQDAVAPNIVHVIVRMGSRHEPRHLLVGYDPSSKREEVPEGFGVPLSAPQPTQYRQQQLCALSETDIPAVSSVAVKQQDIGPRLHLMCILPVCADGLRACLWATVKHFALCLTIWARKHIFLWVIPASIFAYILSAG